MHTQQHPLTSKTAGLLINLNENSRKIIFIICVTLCLTPFISPAIALLMGLVIAQFTGHPYLHLNHKATHLLLQISVVGLGFGMNVHSAMQAGKEGVLFTIASITGTLIFGYFMGKWLNIEKKTSYLISAGTAICGGSAIAAISPVIKAEEKQISVALGCVFILNSIALFIFPMIGHHFNLSQTQFGLWCAIAIHDTSSVVGAASKYGPHALEVATTVKLARALWIIPVAFMSTFIFKNKSKKISIPYFIGLFVLAMIANTYIPATKLISPYMIMIAKAGLTLTLFLIGAGLSRKVLVSVGFKPLFQGVVLWIAISCAALYAVMHLA
ncbi:MULTISPECIES: YeiH family protein [Mucilaginibacter]|uniref:Integral membrane protein (TIGR00698 family) n=2 Tax=Mucilaginibacter TaxID=423349 RepID=A0A4Y8AFL0_9SPHI|nr:MULTISPECIES: putative sulfate exporter family transporter [Mucilaginibacter]MBB3971179.1 putative integral membrane protein (TIGR00698 family) [Mucilaginibacter phyllosphaerae]RFZ83046.1 putative sulfate exporter family transporter [Mucilaginibacter terrenus]TEW66912.1 putative sulfate exporter family transporter [Mucilaginibacter phyllosphaerae]GGH12744.1 membrane protein [Mucilaginibacter phyllosphaerae]